MNYVLGSCLCYFFFIDLTAEKLQVSSNLSAAAAATTGTSNNQSITNNNIVRASPIVNDLNSPYSCRECNKVFSRQGKLYLLIE